MTDRTITLTPAEVERFKALAVGESMWLVREGQPHLVGWDRTAPGPPAVFVQACAPCETCGGSRCAVTMLEYGLLAMEKPCPDCRIELVGPCPRCEGTGNELLTMYRRCSDCHGMMTITLGYAYAVGQPLPIYSSATMPHERPYEYLQVKLMQPHMGGGGHYSIATYRRNAGGGYSMTPEFAQKAQQQVAHYGPPETLVGQWALQLAEETP